MRLRVETPSREDYIYFPVSENKLQETCDKLGINNNMTDTIKIIEDFDNNRLEPLLMNKQVNLEELNFLSKKLDTLKPNQLNTFYAVATAQKLDNIKDLINLSFNTHCYSLVNDFSDLDKLGKQLYLNEQLDSDAKVLDYFDGKGYVEEIIANNPHPLTSVQGFIYKNKNTPEEVYNGKTFPLLVHNTPLVIASLKTETDTEYLFLPCKNTEMSKALERLDIEDISSVNISICENKIPRLLIQIAKAENINELNHFAREMKNVGSDELDHLANLARYMEIDNLQDLKTLSKTMYEFEFLPDVKNANDYARHMIMKSGRFDYDENLEEYIDFDKYAIDSLRTRAYSINDKGYLCYMGYNQEMAKILNSNIGFNLEIEEHSEILKLYMPLKITSYYEEDRYGEYVRTDYEDTVSNSEFIRYNSYLNDFLQEYQDHYETDRKLMEYYGERDTVNAKVKSLHFEIERVGSDIYGVAVAVLNAPLDVSEIEKLKEIAIGQAADGVGEGFEQQEYDHRGQEINIHLWSSDNDWYIKTSEEMGFEKPVQNMGMTMGGIQ